MVGALPRVEGLRPKKRRRSHRARLVAYRSMNVSSSRSISPVDAVGHVRARDGINSQLTAEICEHNEIRKVDEIVASAEKRVNSTKSSATPGWASQRITVN